MTGNIRLRLESIWSGCAAHARLRGLVVVCDGMALNSSHNLCSTFLLFFFFLFVCSILHLCGERRKEIIFSREKNDERRSEKKKHWWRFQTLDDVWYACDKKNTIYSNVLTHAFYNISSINVPFGWVAHWRWCVVRFLKTSWHWVCVGSSCECGRVEAPNTKRWFLAYSGFFCDFDDGLMRERKPRTHESWVRK